MCFFTTSIIDYTDWRPNHLSCIARRKINLPEWLQSVSFDFPFDTNDIKLYEPTDVIREFCDCEGESLDDLFFVTKMIFPDNLKKLKLNTSFNKKIDFLPQNLTHLTIGGQYNEKFTSETFPKTIKYINLECDYVDDSFFEVINDLPELEYIEFSGKFDVVNLNSNTVTHIGFKNLTTNQANLPNTIKKIHVCNAYISKISTKKYKIKKN
jgi:hypothetical protein